MTCRAKPRILVLTAYYLPGFRAGGPLRTLANLVSALVSEFEFRIVTRDRDLGEAGPYPAAPAAQWTQQRGAAVFYCPPSIVSPFGIRRVLRDTEHDLLYVNSLFDAYFSIVPLLLRRLGCIPRRALVLAPRGECGPAALQIRSFKKRVFLFAARLTGLHRDVLWHASSEIEAADVRRAIGRDATIVVAPDLPADPACIPPRSSGTKRAGELEVLFLARVSPMKNLDFVLQVLRQVRGKVRLRIVGPIEDAAYWARCRALIDALPDDITVECHGPVPHEEAWQHLQAAQLLFLPTRGENFGHVLFEALAAGCPVLTSDRTLWRRLPEQGVGWDLPLDRPDLYVRAVEAMVACGATEFGAMSQHAADYAARWYRTNDSVGLTRAVFGSVNPSRLGPRESSATPDGT